jgi:hypothetical protein
MNHDPPPRMKIEQETVKLRQLNSIFTRGSTAHGSVIEVPFKNLEILEFIHSFYRSSVLM